MLVEVTSPHSVIEAGRVAEPVVKVSECKVGVGGVVYIKEVKRGSRCGERDGSDMGRGYQDLADGTGADGGID